MRARQRGDHRATMASLASVARFGRQRRVFAARSAFEKGFGVVCSECQNWPGSSGQQYQARYLWSGIAGQVALPEIAGQVLLARRINSPSLLRAVVGETGGSKGAELSLNLGGGPYRANCCLNLSQACQPQSAMGRRLRCPSQRPSFGQGVAALGPRSKDDG